MLQEPDSDAASALAASEEVALGLQEVVLKQVVVGVMLAVTAGNAFTVTVTEVVAVQP